MTADDEPEILQGGVANAGAVVRFGNVVERPSNSHSPTIHAYLRHLRATGFEGASEPLSIDGERERLTYVPGDVPVPPYPHWAQTDRALASLGRLQRGLHDAGARFHAAGGIWSEELSDDEPGDGAVICHNDICPENVVFRHGEAVALLDFDYAAPGRRAFDVAVLARMCVPIDDDVSAAALGWSPADRPRRLRVLADAYGLDAVGRDKVMTCLDESIARGGEFVLRHVEAGETGFVEMWNAMGGMERFDRRRRWWVDARSEFASAMAD